jgi:ubiquinol-cytochrome c reductase cytochrome b subunit
MTRPTPLTRRAVESVAGRLGAGHGLTKAMRKVFPTHFSFLWGEIALYSLVVLIVTGVYLTFLFEGSQQTVVYDGSYGPLVGHEMSAAYDSVVRTSFDTRGGLLIRQTHHWAALTFVAAIVLHLGRVFFTGAFRRPRDLNWYVGCTLLILALAAGFTGYSLPDDLLSGTGLRIANGIMLAIPVVGERVAGVVFGGEWPGQGIIGRLYPIHILILPALILGLVGAHLGIVWRQKHTQFPGPGRTEANVVGEPVWPGFAMKSIGLLFLTAAAITVAGSLLTVNAIWLYGPYEPAAATSFAQPDWYIGFLEGSVRLFPPWEPRIGRWMLPEPFLSGAVLPGIVFGVLFAVPLIDRRVSGDHRDHHLLDRPRDAPRRTASGVAGLSFVVLLFLGGAQDIVAGTIDVSVGHVTTVLQLALLVVPPVAWWISWRLCRSLEGRPAPEATERHETVVRTASGGYRSAETTDVREPAR